jgi:hypothetical protein
MLWVLALFACIVSAVYLPRTLSDHHGTLGYVPEGSRFGDRAAHRIVAFEPGSPLPANGVAVGDLIVAPPRGGLLDGERVTLQVVRGSQPRIVEVRAAAAARSSTLYFTYLFEGALGLLALFLGTLLILRRWRDPAALALANVMLVGTSGLVPVYFPVGNLAVWNAVWVGAALSLALILLAWVALLMSPATGKVRRWVRGCCYGVMAACVAWSGIAGWYFSGRALPATNLLVAGSRTALQAIAFALCVIAFVGAWRRVEAEQRERLRWLFVGLGCCLVTLGLTVAGIAIELSPPDYLVVSLVSDIFAAAGFVILAYAILGQRVIDVGFAINRAIVYAVLTGIMLMGFGVVEWLVDHVLEFEERKQSVLLDGLLALGIFLVFHRLQHWISHTVQHLFFRSWHVRAEALDRFLEMSEHFTDPDALTKASLEALDAYTDATGTALYGRDAQGRFVLMQSTLPGTPPAFGANDLTVVRLNASQGKPLMLESAGALQDENWYFPLARRGKLAGLLRLGPRHNRDVYRPDQIERVWRAIRQVGFDLHVLRLEQAANRAAARAPGDLSRTAGAV